ncbi:uncharacterized protein Dwil_GK12990 [Drosophila willistoni]|uniref:C2H2-type domain-containing protein n=1 Tax=Drosophila willistoni TaxID=7260 RepID=B4NHU3_DROWI|nr:zinc finger protein 629 [Drosophila willistoni]EDW84703.1 uncharacterized protein Dwil_GK12990 [Drosophila willistoni]
MEGMDLWTSMFSNDFEEGEESEQYGNGTGTGVKPSADTDDIMAEAYDGDEGVDDDDDLMEMEDNGEMEATEEEGRNGKQKGPEPDDDAIFDFELEPIVSIAEHPTTPLGPAGPTSASVRPMHRNSLPAGGSISGRPKEMRLSGVQMRPTTSQINATDEHGVPINYELGVIYICPACGAEFRQQDQWKRHMNQMHQFNTRRGLNFVAMDKLYQRCLECNKRIAMHSRENLLKHKFTHLPYRCTKCYLCKREYKYRQDLMVHLRMVHCEEIVNMMRGGYSAAGRKTRVREPRTERKEFCPEDDDAIEVRNEVLEPDLDDSSFVVSSTSLVEEEQPQNSTPQPLSAKRKRSHPSGNGSGGATELCEDYIHYMCPDCGTECENHAQWSQHIEFVHDYVSRRGLNFRSVDMQMQCLECKQIVTPNTIKTLRAHKFSHLPQPEWLRCKLCYKSYTEHHELVTHLLKHHNLETLIPADGQDEQLLCAPDDDGGDGGEMIFDDADEVRRRGGRISSDDIYEPHIDYLCPQCGKEFMEKKHWRTHVVQVHGMNDIAKLNFEIISERQLKCTECEKIITNAYGIQNAQQHRITHLPFKAYARCRKCHKTYTDRKGLVKHLATYHRVGWETGRKSGVSGDAPLAPKQPRKQIVTVANETYEIIYLDEEPSNVEENDFGEQMQADDDEYAPAPPPPPVPPPNPPPTRFKCSDCGSIHTTQMALKMHIREEHGLRESKNISKKNTESKDEKKRSSASSASSTHTPNATSMRSPGTTIEQNYIFLCPSCGEEYKTQFEWRRHINESHNFDKREYLNMRQLDKYRYQCTQCKDIVCNSKLKGLQDHHFRHLPYRLYLKCLVCGTCYNHKPNIAAHLRTRHNIFERETPWREQRNKPQYAYVQSKDSADKEKRSQRAESPVASSSSSSVSAMGSSRTLKPQPGGLPTRPAGLNTLEDSISYHNAVDLDFITYYCPKCNQNFDSHAFWRKHIVEQHNFNCREGLNFRQIDNHHYLCLECYKRVTVTHTKGAIGQLQSHKFRHLPYRSFKCLTCNGEFVRKQMFFKHLNRDTNRCDNRPSGPDAPVIDDDDQEGAPGAGGEVVTVEDEEVDPSAYRLMCPQCGDNIDTSSKAVWREHINIYHGLGKKELLHMRKIGDDLYRCYDCDEELQTKKLRVLQQHRFRHLPYAAYIRCLLCENPEGDDAIDAAAGLHSMRELQQHIREHHPAIEDNDEQMQNVRQQAAEEEGDEDSHLETETAASTGSGNGPYMPLPPHLLDDADDFEEQYLLG